MPPGPYRYTVTHAERLLLAKAMRWAAGIWKYDPLSTNRLNMASWLEAPHRNRFEMEYETVKDTASSLAYWMVCQDDPTAKRAGYELLIKLIQPFAEGKTKESVDNALQTAKTMMKESFL